MGRYKIHEVMTFEKFVNVPDEIEAQGDDAVHEYIMGNMYRTPEFRWTMADECDCDDFYYWKVEKSWMEGE